MTKSSTDPWRSLHIAIERVVTENTKLQSALDGFEPWMVEWLHPSHPGPDMGELLAIYHGEITENYRPGFDSWLKTRIATTIKNALEAK